MKVEINVNEIENGTLAKLTRGEIGKLGLYNCGIYAYKGILKSRVKGLKRTKCTDAETYFESEHKRWEFVRIYDAEAHADGIKEYALRCYNKKEEAYEEFYPVLIGCDFFK